ncbi:MAG: bifunctional phosphopantothenoylcysteine decarboxylase/phosphopantothenate--cysteine ligase CoaBC [Gammaproteobacteria bacterium]|nr:bifunctional phosphopantothenoylcysteine decarboxylase/phosphopantothenate--cysteine ligase CoaBC [Gammaproteobacteria bacterium]
MGTLANKRVILGVTGGIAAYKSAELLRRLQTAGAEVRVVMTAAATEFVTPLTFQALSGHPVHLDLLDPAAEAAMGHIALARWADVILVAPASADFIARLAQGEGSDLLTTLCLASIGPVAVAPAMNQAMWAKPATSANVGTLRERGIHVFGPAAGYQACGDTGAGRMEEPAVLTLEVAELFATGALEGRKVVITAGPTREAIDPVRYLSNHSSGKMGYALAEAAREAGADTVLISGPVALPAPARVRCVKVTSAAEMLAASLAEVADADLFIAAAAVADYRPRTVAGQKIKKSGDILTLELEPNPDIVATVAALPKRPFVVGFAAETENLLDNARSKLLRKRLDLVIANDVSDAEIGFGSDDNQVLLISALETLRPPRMNKTPLARLLIDHIATLMRTGGTANPAPEREVLV